MKIVDITPDAYLNSLDDDTVAAAMRTLDGIITGGLPDRRRVLWQGVFWGGTDQTIIGYGHIVQPRPRGEDVEWFLIGLARQKTSYSIYVNAVLDGQYLGHHYADRLGTVKLGAANISFRSIDHIDTDGLAELVDHANRITPSDPT